MGRLVDRTVASAIKGAPLSYKPYNLCQAVDDIFFRRILEQGARWHGVTDVGDPQASVVFGG